MELLCPQCQQRLTIPDQYAGQVMRCPLCNGTFTAPALTAPPPVFAPPPPPSPPSPPEMVSATPPLPNMEIPSSRRDTAVKLGAPPAPEPAAQPSLPPPPPVPPPPPGESTRSFRMWISPRVVPWITPIGLFLVFLMTFLPWLRLGVLYRNAWSLGFGGNEVAETAVGSDPLIGMVVLLALLALLVSIPAALFALRLVPVPPFITTLGCWRPAIPGGIALLAFIVFFIRYLDWVVAAMPTTLWYKLAFRFHLVVVVASLLEFWLELRRQRNLPLPSIDVKW